MFVATAGMLMVSAARLMRPAAGRASAVRVAAARSSTAPALPAAPPSAPAVPAATAAEPTPAPGRGALLVTTGWRARIELDGAVVAPSAESLALADVVAGNHELVVTAPGGRPVHRSFTVEAGRTTTVALQLDPPPRRRGRRGATPTAADYLLIPTGRMRLTNR